MTIPYFLIDSSGLRASSGTLWTHIGQQPLRTDVKGSIAVTRYRGPDGSQSIILGYVILQDRIANDTAAGLLAERIDDDRWLAGLDGEFLLLHADRDKLRIVTSRFGYLPFWYALHNGNLLGSTLFAAVWDHLRASGRTGIDAQSLFETLVYKRVFGTKTPHPDIQILPPARRMTFNGERIQVETYWQPDFSNKLPLSLDQAADELSARVERALRRKTSDGRRYALYLSGGMDTRVILAHAAAIGLNLPCITINAFENREVRIARKAAQLAGQDHVFIETPAGHYQRTLDEAVELTGAMSMPMCMFHGHHEKIFAIADVGLHGHGFDYFFQGMYIPATRYKLLGRTLPFRTQRQITGDVVDDFLTTVSYQLKGKALASVARPDIYASRMAQLREELHGIAADIAHRSTGPADVYEWLAFHNLARHYSVGDHWGINTVVEQRTVSFDRDLYELYCRLPAEIRFDARIMRRCLERRHPGLATLVSANHGYPIALSSGQRTIRAGMKFLSHRLWPKRAAEANEFDRMGLPQQHLIEGEWREAMHELARSSRLDALDFLDPQAARQMARDAADGRAVGNPQFVVLLMSIDRFLENHA